MVNSDDAVIRERDQDRCARCGSPRDLHVHHRMLRSAGRDERACNKVTLCASCHHWAHHHPGAAMDEGWIVSRYRDAAEVRVNHWLWPAYPVWLEDDGGIRLIELLFPQLLVQRLGAGIAQEPPADFLPAVRASRPARFQARLTERPA